MVIILTSFLFKNDSFCKLKDYKQLPSEKIYNFRIGLVKTKYVIWAHFPLTTCSIIYTLYISYVWERCFIVNVTDHDLGNVFSLSDFKVEEFTCYFQFTLKKGEEFQNRN